MSNLSAKLFGLADKALNIAKKFEAIPNKYPEILALIFYPILVIFFGYFHEPWYDEAQVWQIAKCASYHDIIFYLPHFEGHPPFWHLFLSIFAKNHFPFLVTVKTITYIFSYISIILIIFKSPFCRILRIFLPFTYFLFYQYAIISRPYCITMIAFAILAIYFYKKNEKPFKYALGLIILAISQPYSFIIASFLTLSWFIETVKEKCIKNKNIILTFILLFLLYVFIAYTIIPSPEADAMLLEQPASIYKRLIYTFFVTPADCFLLHVSNYLPGENPSYYMLFIASFIGSIFLYFIYYYTKGKKYLFLTFLLPYIPFAIFATKYFAMRHLIIPFCFFLFICWITINYPKDNNNDKEDKNSKQLKQCFTLLVAVSLFISTYWNFKACMLDVFIPYAKGKKEADFIKKYHLDNYKIMVQTTDNKDEKTGKVTIAPQTNGTWLTVAPYFDKNIFYNFNDGKDDKNYIIGKHMSDEEIQNTFEKWKKQGIPEVLADTPKLSRISDNLDLMMDYTIVYANNSSYIMKEAVMQDEIIIISVRNDIAKKLNMKAVEPQTKCYKADLRSITSYIVAKALIWYNRKHKEAK